MIRKQHNLLMLFFLLMAVFLLSACPSSGGKVVIPKGSTQTVLAAEYGLAAAMTGLAQARPYLSSDKYERAKEVSKRAKSVVLGAEALAREGKKDEAVQLLCVFEDTLNELIESYGGTRTPKNTYCLMGVPNAD